MNGLLTRGLGFSRFSGVYVFAGMFGIFSIWLPHTFPNSTTLQTVVGNQAITGVAALGLVCAMSVGGFDLSVGNVIGLSSTVGAALMVRHHVTPALAIIIVLALGLCIGAINGILVVRFRINAIVATLGMSSAVIAFDDKITDGQFITPVPKSFAKLTSGQPLGIPTPFLVLIAVALLTWYVLEHTPLGRKMVATGSGPDAARLAGTKTGRMQFVGLMMASTLASLAGLMLLSTVGSAAPDAGPPYLLPLFAAVYLGSTQIKPGRFNIWGTMVALYVLAIGVKGLELAGGQYWVSELFNGAALLIAVAIAVSAQDRRRWLAARLHRRRRPPASLGNEELAREAAAAEQIGVPAARPPSSVL